MEQIRIVLAEDQTILREGTRHILLEYPDIDVVGEAADGQQALELIERLHPDVAILDIRMPKMGGVEVVRRMHESAPNTRALILTSYDDDEYVLGLMEAGASGYLLKTCQAEELVEAVRTVNSGESVLHPAIAAKVARLWRRRQAPAGDNLKEPLTSREREVLELAAKGLRSKEIGEKLGVSARTVNGHLQSIYVKLGVSSRFAAVMCAASRHWITLNIEDQGQHEN